MKTKLKKRALSRSKKKAPVVVRRKTKPPISLKRLAVKSNETIAESVEFAKETGETPLQYMLRNMRDKKVSPLRRDDLAKAAAPYVHPKLSSIVLKGDKKNPVRHINQKMSAKEAAEAYAETLDEE